MDRLPEKQAAIEHKRIAAATGYPSLWRRMISEWQSPEETDRVWLLYAANYLFRTAGVRWALDPLTLRQRVPFTPEGDVALLSAMDYVVLTHRHADHMDLDLLRKLRDFPIRWIVPEHMLDSVRTFHLPEEKLIVPHMLEPIRLPGLTLTPFNGLHLAPDPGSPNGLRGVPETGYLAEFSGKRWLIPGDTRVYDASQLPAFGPVDGLFAHVWLGRGCALQKEPILMDAFCRFCLDLSPGRIVLSHLEEFGRNEDEFWDDTHVEMIKKQFQRHESYKNVLPARMGESVGL
jgi:Beta-lactamase superfamily domain